MSSFDTSFLFFLKIFDLVSNFIDKFLKITMDHTWINICLWVVMLIVSSMRNAQCLENKTNKSSRRISSNIVRRPKRKY